MPAKMSTNNVLSERFEAVGEVAVDERNRISLTKALESLKALFKDTQGLRFSIQVNEAGQLLLSPVVSVPLHEAWLYRNPDAIAKLRKGLSQVGGQLKDLGAFEKYADDDIE